MIPTLLKKIFGSRNDRLLKQIPHSGPGDQRARTGDREALATTQLRAKTAEFKQRVAKGESLDELLPEAFAVVREAGKRALQDAPFRRAADRRHGAALRQDRRDAHRRGQDAGGDAAGLPECAVRQGRARRHRQRLPGQPRRRVDGAASTASSA